MKLSKIFTRKKLFSNTCLMLMLFIGLMLYYISENGSILEGKQQRRRRRRRRRRRGGRPPRGRRPPECQPYCHDTPCNELGSKGNFDCNGCNANVLCNPKAPGFGRREQWQQPVGAKETTLSQGKKGQPSIEERVDRAEKLGEEAMKLAVKASGSIKRIEKNNLTQKL